MINQANPEHRKETKVRITAVSLEIYSVEEDKNKKIEKLEAKDSRLHHFIRVFCPSWIV